jgi:hypothetical protein
MNKHHDNGNSVYFGAIMHHDYIQNVFLSLGTGGWSKIVDVSESEEPCDGMMES